MTTVMFKSQFSIPWKAPSLNRLLRQHWSTRARALETVALYIVAAIGKPREPIQQKMRVTIRVVCRIHRQDQDNSAGGVKIILDALKRLGWIRDDAPQWCELVHLPCELATLGEKAHVDITLETV